MSAEEEEGILSALKLEEVQLSAQDWLKFSTHTTQLIRKRVVQHIRCPHKALEVLSSDNDASIRAIAIMRLRMRLNSRE
jgi:hypothetical protein